MHFDMRALFNRCFTLVKRRVKRSKTGVEVFNCRGPMIRCEETESLRGHYNSYLTQ